MTLFGCGLEPLAEAGCLSPGFRMMRKTFLRVWGECDNTRLVDLVSGESPEEAGAAVLAGNSLCVADQRQESMGRREVTPAG
jgi:hypothetical protein